MPIRQDDPAVLFRVHQSSRGLTDEQIHTIAQHVEVVRFEDNQIVHRPDEKVQALLLILAGRLRTSVVLPGGSEQPLLYYRRDEQFGLLGLTQHEPFPISVVAEQQTLVLRIPAQTAEQLMADVPLWRRNLLRSLGPQMKDALLGQDTRQRRRFVVMIHTCTASRHLTTLLAEQLTHLGERVGLLSDHPDPMESCPHWSASLLHADGSTLTHEEVRSRIGEWSEADRILLDIDLCNTGDYLIPLMSACAAAYWFCTSVSTDRVAETLRDIRNTSPELCEKMCVVRLLSPHEPVASLNPALSEVCGNELKLHWNGCGPDSPARSQQAGLERLIRHLRGVSIGLALGGGAARGMAHLGVLQAFDRAGISFDRMSGTSAGALTGILYAAGYSADYLIEAFSRDLKPGWLYRLLPGGDGLYVFLKYRLNGWDRMLRKYLHDWDLQQLAIPFSSVGVDLVSGTAVVREQGDAIHALLESINLPGIARPICRDGQALVDGGVLNVVHSDILVGQGSNLVIASDVAAKIALEFAGNRPETPTGDMKVPGGIAAVVRTRTVQDRNIRSVGGDAADIVIEPDVSRVKLTDFKNARNTAELGRAATEAVLPSVRSVLHNLDPQLFPSTEN